MLLDPSHRIHHIILLAEGKEMNPSVKDITDFESLPEEVRRLAERYYKHLLEDAKYDVGEAYRRGYKDGRKDAEDDAKTLF